jgi:hypothetical protein
LLFDDLPIRNRARSLFWRQGMIQNQDPGAKEKADTSMSLETLIAMGLFGWIALSMALMGLGIW